MKRSLFVAGVLLLSLVGIGCGVVPSVKPANLNTPAEIAAYQNSNEYKSAVQAQLDEIRTLFANAIQKDIKDGHSTVAYVHLKNHHKGAAVAIIVEEVKAKGWIVEKSVSESMLLVSAPKK